jgi:hypothetical protein
VYENGPQMYICEIVWADDTISENVIVSSKDFIVEYHGYTPLEAVEGVIKNLKEKNWKEYKGE